jgi:hypothetical protein
MAAEISDRVREALERLDQTIDRLDSSVAEAFEHPAPEPPPPDGSKIDNAVLAERLDKIIARIEAALVE